jgi:uncharacterized membrane protein YjgN (DUF898 family)
MDAQAASTVPSALPASARFIGDRREYSRILARDAGLLIVTLGLYRFWVANDVRTYMWCHTEVAGDELEYTGDPVELLVGFLVLVAILCPLFAAVSIMILTTGQVAFSILLNYAAIGCLAPITVLALYQARRYRMSHTLFRGLRFRQKGSAWIYALRTAGWFVINMLTLGLSYPWARKSLERYKMRHAFYGDLQGDFQGSARGLFKTGFVLWLVVLVPAICLFAAATAAGATGDNALNAAAAWLVPAGLIVYPGFHANVLRWRIGNMRLGPVTLSAPFSTWSLYKAYLRFAGLMVGLAIVLGVIAAVWQLKIQPALPSPPPALFALAIFVALALVYFATATAIAFAYQATVRFTLWGLIANSLTLTNIDALDTVKAQPGWVPRHEGRIAGALNIGGF